MFPIFRRSKAKPAQNRRIYLDYAAAAPLSSQACAAMTEFLGSPHGNASAIHAEGQSARLAVETARLRIARLVQVQPGQILFTSGGTESNNLAIRGVVEKYHQGGRAYGEMEIITTMIEHPATRKTVEAVSRLGVVVHFVSVDTSGLVVLEELKKLLTEKTILVCISFVNSEIGTVEAVGAISRVLAKTAPDTLLFVDAAQAPLWLPCVMPQLRADLLAFDAGKFGGPQGVGMMAVSKRVELAPVTFGGGQEQGLRPGTEPGVLIVGMAAAFAEAQTGFRLRAEKVAGLRDYTFSELKKAIPTILINGGVGDIRVANNVNISIPGLDSEYAVVTLDVHGVAASTKSACSSAGGGLSTVVMETTHDAARAASTMRFTLGPSTTKSDIDTLVRALTNHLATTARL